MFRTTSSWHLISIHALLAESDGTISTNPVPTGDFNPRSPCGERRWALPGSPFPREISIHALLAESDPWRSPCGDWRRYFNPRSPCGERPLNLPEVNHKDGFQSTLSLRRATLVLILPGPRHPISIHALLAESDPDPIRSFVRSADFNPRSPCGERPGRPTPRGEYQTISIHALLAESDRDGLFLVVGTDVFQSTLSLRRATSAFTPFLWDTTISIHALLAESD